MAKRNTVIETNGFCAYIGPTIVGVIQNGTIYSDPKEIVLEELSSVIEKYPKIASLIIPGDRLAEERQRAKTPGNITYINYHSVMSGKN